VAWQTSLDKGCGFVSLFVSEQWHALQLLWICQERELSDGNSCFNWKGSKSMPLRALSYNIWYGGQDRLPLIADVIKQQQPDAVALLEATSRSHAEQLADNLGMQLVFGEANSVFHVAWMSRLPIVRWKNHRLPVLYKTLLEIELSWNNAPLCLFATHLHAGRWREDDERRAQEMRAILDILRERTDQLHLLVGDFNTVHPMDTPGSRSHSEGPVPDLALSSRSVIPLLLEASYVDCYRMLHPTKPGYTFGLPEFLWLRPDYIFASSGLAPRLTACDVVSDPKAINASDHLPVWAEFQER
jgi:exodeoxyribonuclease III